MTAKLDIAKYLLSLLTRGAAEVGKMLRATRPNACANSNFSRLARQQLSILCLLTAWAVISATHAAEATSANKIQMSTLLSLVRYAAQDRLCLAELATKNSDLEDYSECINSKMRITYCDATAPDLESMALLMDHDSRLKGGPLAIRDLLKQIVDTCPRSYEFLPLDIGTTAINAPSRCDTWMPVLLARSVAFSTEFRSGDYVSKAQACAGNAGTLVMGDHCSQWNYARRSQAPRAKRLAKELREYGTEPYFCSLGSASPY